MHQLVNKLKHLLSQRIVNPEQVWQQFWVYQPPEQLENLRKSAVLVLLFPNGKQLKTILIKRIADGSVHSGQIGFPGGQWEKSDKSLIQTALREAHEEVGIDTSRVQLIGTLSPVLVVVSRFSILPVVAWCNHEPQTRINPQEIERSYSVALDTLFQPPNPVEQTVRVSGKTLTVRGYLFDGGFVWGASARILAELAAYLNLLK